MLTGTDTDGRIDARRYRAPGDDDARSRAATGVELLLALRASACWEERFRMLSVASGRNAFLEHVVRCVPFYRDLDGRDFPLVTRDEVAQEPARFTAPVRDGEPIVAAKTSGSTGLPLTVPYDLAGWYGLNYATYETVIDSIPGARKAVVPGEPAIVLVSNERNRIPIRIVLPSLDAALFVREPIGVSTQRDQALVRRLRLHAPPVIYGKASYLLDLIRLDETPRRGRSRIAPAVVLVSGENLFGDVRRRLETWFGAPVIDAYISAEGGLIALGCPAGTGLHVRSDRVALEVLRDDGAFAESGSGELVLTNFTNWAMAIVRYRTRDRAVVEIGTCACGHVGQTIARLYGREPPAFRIGSGTVDTDSLDEIFSARGVVDHQVLEAGGGCFVAKAVLAAPWTAAARAELARALSSTLHARHVDVRVLERITKHGGKMRRYLLADDPANELAQRGPRPQWSGPWHAATLRGPVQSEPLRYAAFVQSGRYAASVARCGTLMLWERRGTAYEPVARRSIGPVRLAASDSALGVFIVVGEDERLSAWYPCDERIDALGARPRCLTAIAVSAHSGLLATATEDGSVEFVDLRAGCSGPALDAGRAVCSLALAPDGESIAVGHNDGSIALWDTVTGIPLFTVVDDARPRALMYASKGKLLAALSERARVRVWHLASAAEKASLRCRATAIAFHPGGAWLFTADTSGRISMHDAAGGAVRVLADEGEGITHLAAAPSGDAVLSVGERLGAVLRVRVHEANA